MTEEKETGGRHDREVTHALDRIEPCLDGELSPEEEAKVRDHCRRCESCGRAMDDAIEVRQLLAEEPPPEPLRPVWHGVSRRIGNKGARSPRRSFAFHATAAAATAAGILFGLLLGPQQSSTETAWQTETWSEMGTLLAGDAGTTLADLFFADEEGDNGS